MNTKISKEGIAKTFGYGNYTSFNAWKKTPELIARFDWLKTSAILIKNGFNYFEVLGLADKNKDLSDENQVLKDEIIELTDAINKHADKMEALQDIQNGIRAS